MKSPKTLFREYFRRRLISAGKKLAGDELEDFIAEAAAEWEREPCAEYGGLSPKEYFADIGDAAELIRLLAADIKEGGEPLAVITDRLAELPGAAGSLAETVCSDEADEELRIVAADLLWQRGSVPVEEFADIVFSATAPVALRERLIEILGGCGGETEQAVLPRIGHVAGDDALVAGELLVRSGSMTDETLDFLLSLTESADTLPRALQLLSDYGDTRTIPRLKELARTCDYATYTDIRSAVEAMGGELDVERDWSGDATYGIIKGGNK